MGPDGEGAYRGPQPKIGARTNLAPGPASPPARGTPGKRSLVDGLAIDPSPSSAATAVQPRTGGHGGNAPQAPDLHGAPYQWVPGTFNLWVNREWFQGAPDFAVSGGQWIAPSRIRELLTVLRDSGMLTWAAPERIARAADQLGIAADDAPVSLIRLGTSVFDSVGLPPGTSALVGKASGHGLDVVIAVPNVQADEGKQFSLSLPAKQQLVTAVEGFTHLAVIPVVRQQILDSDLKATLGAGTTLFHLNAATCAQLFGKAEYDQWLARPAGKPGELAFDIAAGNQSFGDLTPDEVTYVQTWLKQHLTGGTAGRPVVMSRTLLDALHELDGLPAGQRERVVAMLRGTGKAPQEASDSQLSARLLERLMQQAKFDEEREAAGFTPEKPEKPDGHDRPPAFDVPFPARIDQQNGLVLAGEDVEFTLLIDWPVAYTADQQSEYTWRPMKAKIDWLFERDQDSQKHQARQTSQVDWKHDGQTNHSFQLGPGEDSAVWTVHAFVHHNFFQPNHLITQVEVKTEQKRLQELRREAFQPLGQPAIDDADHDFSTSTFNEWFGDHDYDHGLRFRGELPADFQRRTPDQRKATLEHEIKTNEAMLAYLRHGNHPDAVAACEHYLAKLRDAVTAMDIDVVEGWQPFDVRGAFLGRGNHVADGPLDLYGAVQRQTHRIPGDEFSPPTRYEQVHVQIRDLSRRLEAENYRFEGSGDSFEQALEAAFVDLCKQYPGGKVSILAEGIAPQGKAATGKTVGFELDTGSAWKDTKAKVFDPVINVAVNIAGAIASIFAPEIAIPLLLLYNETQNVDQLIDELDSGTLTTKKGVMHLAQLGLDVMPLAGRAPIFRTSKAAFAMFHVTGLAGQALLMKSQVADQIAQIRDTQVKDMAQLYARYIDLEKSTQASDPARATMTAEFDRRAAEIRKTALDVWTSAIANFAVVAVPSHLAGAVHEQLRLGRVAELEKAGRFVHLDGVDPHYDPRRGQIVGDQSRMDRKAIDQLTQQQDAHMRELGAWLAAKLGVDPSKIVLKPGDDSKLWKDGDAIQVRYAPGTDAEQAITGWERDAKKAKIGTSERSGHGHGGKPVHETATGDRPHTPADHEPATGDRPRTPADHETRDLSRETAKLEPELVGGGQSRAHETTAAAVPGSAFRGGVRAGDAAAVVTEAHAVFETAARRFGDVQSVEKVSSAHVDLTAPGGAEEKVRLDNTYLITMKDGSSFTIRVTSGPIGSDAVARTVVNTTKIGANKVQRPGAPSPVNVPIEGRFVVQLNETMDPVNAERALGHEVGEILAQRKRAAQGGPLAEPAVLGQASAPGPGAQLSPHDHGRLGEIKVLAAKVNAGDAAATHEMLALVEDLGLRDGMTGAGERRQLVVQALGDDPGAVHALEKTWQQAEHLGHDLKAQLDTVHEGRRRYEAEVEARKAADKPIHEMPDARPEPGQVITPERAHEMALEAATARANKSAATLHRLRAEAARLPEGQYPRIQDVQIGGGAALAAREPGTLLIDARGRWQADAGDRIAQTANQLAGLKGAGVGDPFQFAQPNERVPMSAVRYWEDSIAAQGPVIDGEVTGIAINDAGKTILTIKTRDGGPPLHVEVEGNLAMATGFPVERLPGTPRGMTPELAVGQIKKALQKVADDPAARSDQRARAHGALADLAPLTGLESRPGQRAEDLTEVNAVLKRHHLDDAIAADPALKGAREMAAACENWHKLTTEHPEKMVLGDMANLDTMDASATDKWIIGGLGGTGISAAEIVLARNEHAHVTMVGDKPPAGLIENDQFMKILRGHADAPTVAQLKAILGLEIAPGDGRFSLVFGVEVETPTMDSHGNVRATGKDKPADWVPPGFTDRDNPMVGGGYISAIGRDGQLPPIAAALKNSVEAKGGRMTMEPMYDRNGQYTHYRLRAFDAAGAELRQLDVTGAASRFPPWELMKVRPEEVALAKDRFYAASDLDAPPESGNFDGGFVASATQASRYAKGRREGDFQ